MTEPENQADYRTWVLELSAEEVWKKVRKLESHLKDILRLLEVNPGAIKEVKMKLREAIEIAAERQNTDAIPIQPRKMEPPF